MAWTRPVAIPKETWEDKSVVIYSKEVVSLIILETLFIFSYTLCSKFLLFTLHYIPIKVLFDLKENMVWILTWLINVCGVIFLVFGILSWDYKFHLFCFTVLHLIYIGDISLCSTIFCSQMFESVIPLFEVILFVECLQLWDLSWSITLNRNSSHILS